MIRDQEKDAVSRAEERLEQLEQDIEDLERGEAELDQLALTDDHIHYLQVTEIRIVVISNISPNITVIITII